jgi:hypothetical protein
MIHFEENLSYLAFKKTMGSQKPELPGDIIPEGRSQNHFSAAAAKVAA